MEARAVLEAVVKALKEVNEKPELIPKFFAEMSLKAGVVADALLEVAGDRVVVELVHELLRLVKTVVRAYGAGRAAAS